MDIKLKGSIYFFVVLLAGCQEESGLVLVNGALWSKEDLVVAGKNSFSYQQALSACPEGWSLTTLEDWAALLERYGGYNNAGDIIGDPEKSFSTLTSKKGFNARKNWYWTATPAWNDAPSIRSYGILFDSAKEEVGNGPLLVGATMRCRCVKRAKPVTSDFISFADDNGFVNYDFYEIYDPSVTLLSVYVHRIPEGMVTVDRILFSMKLPDKFVAAGESPVEPQVVYFAREFNDTDSMFGDTGYDFYAGDYDGSLVKFLISFYDGKVVKGTFSGSTWEGRPIQEGSFSIQIR